MDKIEDWLDVKVLNDACSVTGKNTFTKNTNNKSTDNISKTQEMPSNESVAQVQQPNFSTQQPTTDPTSPNQATSNDRHVETMSPSSRKHKYNNDHEYVKKFPLLNSLNIDLIRVRKIRVRNDTQQKIDQLVKNRSKGKRKSTIEKEEDQKRVKAERRESILKKMGS